MAENIRQKIAELNGRLLELDTKFNLYFSGIEKLPPVKEFDQLKREVSSSVKAKSILMSVSMLFFANSFHQRFSSYRAKWEKKLRDIEEGRTKPGKRFKTL